jgi:ribosome biogenesis SPOUT family RNA methylase Rps3
MHSRVFELTKEPILEDNWLNEDDLCDTSFIGEIADFVTTSPKSEREADIQWLLGHKPGVFSRSGDKLIITASTKRAYLGERYADLKKHVAQLSFTDFCDDFKVCILKRMILDTGSFYVYDNGYWSPLDTFIRDASEGDVFYVGGIVDYHF